MESNMQEGCVRMTKGGGAVSLAGLGYSYVSISQLETWWDPWFWWTPLVKNSSLWWFSEYSWTWSSLYWFAAVSTSSDDGTVMDAGPAELDPLLAEQGDRVLLFAVLWDGSLFSLFEAKFGYHIRDTAISRIIVNNQTSSPTLNLFNLRGELLCMLVPNARGIFHRWTDQRKISISLICFGQG